MSCLQRTQVLLARDLISSQYQSEPNPIRREKTVVDKPTIPWYSSPMKMRSAKWSITEHCLSQYFPRLIFSEVSVVPEGQCWTWNQNVCEMWVNGSWGRLIHRSTSTKVILWLKPESNCPRAFFLLNFILKGQISKTLFSMSLSEPHFFSSKNLVLDFLKITMLLLISTSMRFGKEGTELYKFPRWGSYESKLWDGCLLWNEFRATNKEERGRNHGSKARPIKSKPAHHGVQELNALCHPELSQGDVKFWAFWHVHWGITRWSPSKVGRAVLQLMQCRNSLGGWRRPSLLKGRWTLFQSIYSKEHSWPLEESFT